MRSSTVEYLLLKVKINYTQCFAEKCIKFDAVQNCINFEQHQILYVVFML